MKQQCKTMLFRLSTFKIKDFCLRCNLEWAGPLWICSSKFWVGTSISTYSEHEQGIHSACTFQNKTICLIQMDEPYKCISQVQFERFIFPFWLCLKMAHSLTELKSSGTVDSDSSGFVGWGEPTPSCSGWLLLALHLWITLGGAHSQKHAASMRV